MSATQEQLFYTPPTDEAFNELKLEAIRLWQTYDDTYRYASEKINRIKDLPNVGSNFMSIWQMFDFMNQYKIYMSLSESTIAEIAKRTTFKIKLHLI